MAAREGDIALWLHNKLGSTDDLWSGSSICSQLSREKLMLIQDCFHNLQPHVKVKLLLSFLHIPKRNVEEWKLELDELIQTAQEDTDQWVTMVAEMLKNYPNGGALNTDIVDHQSSFHDILADLRKLVRRTQDARMSPLECSYLSRSAQVSVTGPTQPSVKHFALKRKPKSAALRAELLQKSVEAANNFKKNKSKTPGFSIPMKIRSFAKTLDDSTPMKGIPNNQPSASGFIKASPLGSRFGGSNPIGQRSLANRREGGIKLLDITECPVGAKEAKRRRKLAEQEAQEQQKKEKEAQANTPDYAAGLVNPAALGGVVEVSGGPSYVPPAGATRITDPTTITATQQARDNLQQQLSQQVLPSSAISMVTISNPNTRPTTVTVVTPQQTLPGQPVTPSTEPAQQGAADANLSQPPTQARKGLSLTREQMFAAQEMFRTSNKVTRPEKALILGFMAGSRENPCKQQGDIVNIRLGEEHDSIQQPDGTFKPMMVENFIQMNYANGEWKKIKKYREIDAE